MSARTHFHGSRSVIERITSAGIFGGLFCASSESAAMSHGEVLHEIVSARPLTDYELNYEIEGAWEKAVALCGGDEARAEAIMTPGCEADDAEEGWELQRLRGVLAARLGYTSVEMLDEHGTTWLCLPGCEVQVVKE
jgi:hypothetical protein